MAHAYHHAESSARRFGGNPDDYIIIHSWFDQSKQVMAHPSHRALRHHAWGVYEAECAFGVTITNSDGERVPVRLIAEQHVREDCGGRVPSLADWLTRIELQGWMVKGRIGDVKPEAGDGALGLDAWKAAVMEGRTLLGYPEWLARRSGRPVPMPVLEIALAHLQPDLLVDLASGPGEACHAVHCVLADAAEGVLLQVPPEPERSVFPGVDAILDHARERGAGMVWLSPVGEPAEGLPLHEEAVA